MPADLEALRAAAQKATPGEWRVCETTIHERGYGAHWVETDSPDLIRISGSGGARSYTERVFSTQRHDDNEANARFVVAAQPQTILSLLAERDRLLRVAEAAQAWSDACSANAHAMPVAVLAARDECRAALAALDAKESTDAR